MYLCHADPGPIASKAQTIDATIPLTIFLSRKGFFLCFECYLDEKHEIGSAYNRKRPQPQPNIKLERRISKVPSDQPLGIKSRVSFLTGRACSSHVCNIFFSILKERRSIYNSNTENRYNYFI